MRLWEQIGELDKALNSAQMAENEFEAGRIEQKIHNLPENPHITKEREETLKLSRRSSPECQFDLYEDILELNEKIGFHGFDGQVVADIGTRDGRFVDLFKRLGAADVYGIDPDTEELAKAVQEGKLDSDHAINTTLEDLPGVIAEKITAAAIFNFAIGRDSQPGFFQKLAEILPDNGQALVTTAEEKRFNRLLGLLGMAPRQFKVSGHLRVQTDKNFPHKYLVLLTKRMA